MCTYGSSSTSLLRRWNIFTPAKSFIGTWNLQTYSLIPTALSNFVILGWWGLWTKGRIKMWYLLRVWLQGGIDRPKCYWGRSHTQRLLIYGALDALFTKYWRKNLCSMVAALWIKFRRFVLLLVILQKKILFLWSRKYRAQCLNRWRFQWIPSKTLCWKTSLLSTLIFWKGYWFSILKKGYQLNKFWSMNLLKPLERLKRKSLVTRKL